MAFNIYYDFQLGNKKLSDFGATLWNGGNNAYTIQLLPDSSKYTQSIPYIDGEVYFGGAYNPRTITLYIFINNKNFNESEFVNWIKSLEHQWFNFVGDTKKIKVMYDGLVDLTIYNGQHATMELSFIAHDPYWYKIVDDSRIINAPSVGTTYTITNTGNSKSYPIIHLKGTGTVTNVEFQFNSKRYKIKTFSTDVIIDMETETVYNVVGGVKVNRIENFECINGKFKYEFDVANVGDNSFKINSMTGTLTSATLYMQSRFI